MASAAFCMTWGHDFVAGGRRSTSETCSHFLGSLAQNDRFGSPDFQFSRTSRRKHSFWKPGSSVFEEVSSKTLVLELRILSFRGSLAENALQFSRKSRRKRSFWKSGSSVLEEVSRKTLVLELRILSFRGSLAENACFGSPALQFSRESCIRRSFCFSFRGSLEEFARVQDPDASGPKTS